MNKLKKTIHILLIGLYLVIIVFQIVSIYLSFKFMLWFILWKYSWRFKKVLRKNRVPKDFVKELNSIYIVELRRKLGLSISIKNLLQWFSD